jgi:hypothetical protein
VRGLHDVTALAAVTARAIGLQGGGTYKELFGGEAKV